MPSAKTITLVSIPMAAATLLGIGLALRTDSASKYEAGPTDADQERTVIVAQSATPAENTTSSQLTFPQISCGNPSDVGDTWYPVVIDGADIEKVKEQYCADAIEYTREKTGQLTVQVASFTDRQQAQVFADAVNGEVGEPYIVNDEDALTSAQSEPEVEPLAAPSVVRWQPPEDFDYQASMEGVPMGVRRLNQGYGCSGDEPVCITYEVVSSERCESISAQVAFLNKDGARLDSNFDIENTVPAGQQISFSFGVRDGLVPVVKKIDFSELSCSQY